MQQKTTILKYTKLTVLTVFFGLMSISTFAQKNKNRWCCSGHW